MLGGDTRDSLMAATGHKTGALVREFRFFLHALSGRGPAGAAARPLRAAALAAACQPSAADTANIPWPNSSTGWTTPHSMPSGTP